MGADVNGPRVFITNYSGHDYTKAESYGEIRFVTKGFISFQSLDRVRFQVADSLKETRPDDWLLLSGASIVNVLAVVFWLSMHGRVKLLNYDKTEEKYRELILTEDNIKNLLQVVRA